MRPTTKSTVATLLTILSIANMSALYGKVDSESQEDLIEAPPRPRRRLASARWCPWLIHTSLFCLWLILFVSLRPSTYRQQSTPCERQCSKGQEVVSSCVIKAPADEAIEYRSMLFNGSVTHPSIFEGHPSAELDAAWDRITKIRQYRNSIFSLLQHAYTLRCRIHRSDSGHG